LITILTLCTIRRIIDVEILSHLSSFFRKECVMDAAELIRSKSPLGEVVELLEYALAMPWELVVFRLRDFLDKHELTGTPAGAFVEFYVQKTNTAAKCAYLNPLIGPYTYAQSILSLICPINRNGIRERFAWNDQQVNQKPEFLFVQFNRSSGPSWAKEQLKDVFPYVILTEQS
jgi:hypothetical protein